MMKSLFFLAFLVLCAVRPTAGSAQATATPASPNVTPVEAQQALDVLQDPQKREQLINTLKAIAKAAPASGDTVPATKPAAKTSTEVTLRPNSLGAQLLVVLSEWGMRLADEAAATLQTMNNLPALWRWLRTLETDPQASHALLVTAACLVLVVGCALLLELVTFWALRRPRRTLTAHAPITNGDSVRLMRLLPFALARLLFDLAPVAVFASAGNLLVATVPGIEQQTRLVVIAIVNAYVLCRAVMCVARMLLPDNPRLRLWRLDDASSAFVLAWVWRMAVVAIFGGALVEVALLLGLDQSAHDGFERLIALVLTVMLIIVVVRSRNGMARYLRGADDTRWRGWIAEIWPYLAVMAIVSFWIGTATGTHGGLSGLYFPGVALAAIIAARLLTIVVLGTLERMLRLDQDADAKLPGLSQRIASYRRPLEIVAMAVITALCVVAVLQLWGAPAFRWFVAGGIGTRLISALATVSVAVIVAIAIWEVSHAVLERQLAQAGPGGQVRSVRLLTLLPMLRTVLLVTIVAIVGLTALSEIGVNIAPLLAGAGIAGIAIGFGAQHLVQDVITGIFVLFENAIQIGDGVTVAGLSGAVEQLSIRTLRLRAADGAVHIIPFSAVTSITNNNRGLGNAAVSVTVAFHENTDRVIETLAEIGAAMREEEDYKTKMLGDLQIFGVDQVRPWGVTITGQIVCTDTGRWPVQREFNRRLKKRFEELQIILGAPPAATA
ncbi:MAG TPA: mechanosensitive ion channel domain-containing protein [Stellaceae bacterium]|jgi:small-conductance mechanosensitive channel|nr:mechanosensitive ion channel domain-containing protein [Stellaceae bacterium]